MGAGGFNPRFRAMWLRAELRKFQKPYEMENQESEEKEKNIEEEIKEKPLDLYSTELTLHPPPPGGSRDSWFQGFFFFFRSRGLS